MTEADFARNWAEPDYEPDVVPLRPMQAAPAILATPFGRWGPEADLPVRQWLYGKHLIRGYVSLDVAAGGVGKTALKVGEALAMASGRALFNKDLPEGPLRVWLYNLEDNLDELTLRIRAAAKFHHIGQDDLGDRLFVDSGFDQPCIVATQTGNGTTIAYPVINELIAQIRLRKIDVLTLDPFVSSHSVSENDNMAIDAVVKRAYAHIANLTGCAINLVHHIAKARGEEVTAESARGASSLIGAVRSAQVFNRMTEDEAIRADIEPGKHLFYFRVSNGKANLAPPSDRADWYRMNSVELDNGENVGVAAQFVWPAAKSAAADEVEAVHNIIADGRHRESPQCADWIGHAIGGVFSLNSRDKEDKKKLAKIIGDMVKVGTLEVVMLEDERRHKKPYVIAKQVSG